MSESRYREIVHYTAMIGMFMGVGIMYLTEGAGDHYENLAHICYDLALIVMVVNAFKNFRCQRREKRESDIKDLHSWIEDEKVLPSFRYQKYFCPLVRKIPFRWIDKLKKQTYLTLFSYSYDIEDKQKFHSIFKFRVTDRQLFNLKLKGLVEFDDPKNTTDALAFLDETLEI